MIKLGRKILELWNQFWFKPQDLLGVSLFRISALPIMGIFYLLKWPDFDFMYSDSGFLRLETFKNVMAGQYAPWVPSFFENPAIYSAGFWVLIFALVMITCGIAPRFFSIVALFLHAAFMERNMAVVYGADYLCSFWLLAFCFIDSGKYFHLRFWQKGWKSSWSLRGEIKSDQDMFSSVGRRLVQIQFCIMYGYGGLEKAKGLSWWDGSAILKSLSHAQLISIDFGWLGSIYGLTVAMTFVTLLWEIYFPLLIWGSRTRVFALALGVFIHLGICFSMNLPFFSLLTIAGYFVFFERTWVENIRRSLFGRALFKSDF